MQDPVNSNGLLTAHYGMSLSNAWFCAVLALALNSAAYSTQLFHGAVKAIPKDNGKVVAH